MSTQTQTLFIIACTFLLIGHMYFIGAAGLELRIVNIMFEQMDKFQGPYEFFAFAGIISWCIDFIFPKK